MWGSLEFVSSSLEIHWEFVGVHGGVIKGLYNFMSYYRSICPSKENCILTKNPSYTALLRPTFLRNLPPTQLNGPTRLFGRLEYANAYPLLYLKRILKPRPSEFLKWPRHKLP